MDCNREEAMRAKQVAEKKMENKDFSGALKIAVKAQQLYPELENVFQMILVCEVHCSAENKCYGTDKDWYRILKVEPSADDLSIKKQYRKLALTLHPDKNKFSGSTDAFKLIGEAQRVLLDREKRMIYDSKLRAYGNISASNWILKQPSRQSNVHQHPWNQSSFPQGHPLNSQFQRSGNFQFPQQRAQTGVCGNRPTFWTVCPFCSIRHRFYRDDVLNKNIHCQSCKKSFTAYEMNVQGANQSHQPSSFPQYNKVHLKPTEGTNRNFTSKPVSGGVNSLKKEPPKAQGNVNRKRKKKVVESSESSDSESSSETEEDEPKNVVKHHTDQDFQYFGEQPRRSSRPKRNVSYKENVYDNDDDATPLNQVKESTATSSYPAEQEVKDTFRQEEARSGVKEDHEKKFQMPEVNKASEHKPNSDDNIEETEPEVYECPDPEFTDFDKDRQEESFRSGQIWAAYDTEDAMPRFYAFIRKVVSPGFNLQITWLKPVPGNEDEEKWLEAELPVSCGKFKRGKYDKAEDLPMFSHLVSWETPEKGIFTIIPRKGETWALFRDWSINWYSSTQSDTRRYKYEFVQILSDYDDNVGVRVSYLEKVKGFTCLYNNRKENEALIPPSDKYRISHMVKSFRMSGEEREGVPKGSYELDPASLPASAFEQVSL